MRKTPVRFRYTLVIGLLVLTAALAGGASYAVTQSSPGVPATFYACVSSAGLVRSSTIHLGAAPATCPSSLDTKQSWNAEGRAGTDGAPGAQGAVGQASVVSLDPPRRCPEPPPTTTVPPSDPALGVSTGSVLYIASIPGESTVASHADEIDLQSWSFGALSVAYTTAGCGGSGSGHGTDLKIVKFSDIASPGLFSAAMTGNDLGTIILTSARGPKTLTATLEHAQVSSDISSSDGVHLIETVWFSSTGSTLTSN